uniref:hypothetical protein n=1 Tax=Saccharothrix mutabilis TaxID=33921 RepID=UPI0031D270D8
MNTRAVIMDTSLPSKIDGIDFTVTLRAAWTSDDPKVSRQHGYALTMEHLWRTAELITRKWYVLHHDAAQAAVNAAIDPMVNLESVPLAVTGNATLTASAQAISATRDYLTLRRDEETRRERTSAQLYALRHALKSPGIAELWWASNNPQQLSVIDSDSFKSFVSAITAARDDEMHPKTAIEQVVLKFISEFTGAEDRQLLMNVFKLLLVRFDKHDLLKELG